MGRVLNSNEDPHGMGSLVRLAELFERKSDVLAGISEHYAI